MELNQGILAKISREAKVNVKQTEATLVLLEDQATVPFIARYRKDVTGNLDEVQIRTIAERHEYYKELLARRMTILKSIEEQGKLTEDLKNTILACYEKNELEDLYLPYKPKRKTKATVAIERGMEPLAKFIWEQVPGEKSVEELAETFINSEKGVSSKEEALEGALHIIAEWISESLEIRKTLRQMMLQEAVVVSKVAKVKVGQKTKYDMYYDFREPVAKIPSHRMLAIRRGVKEQVLTFTIEMDGEKALRLISGQVTKDSQASFAPFLQIALKDSYERLLNPGIQTEVRALLKERSDSEAIKVFEANLANLLLAAPAGPIGVMGIDPGFRTGCKVAVVDETGKFLEHASIYPHEPRKDILGPESTLYRMLQQHNIKAIAIGNGTASRETDAFVKNFLRKYQGGESFDVQKLVPNEAPTVATANSVENGPALAALVEVAESIASPGTPSIDSADSAALTETIGLEKVYEPPSAPPQIADESVARAEGHTPSTDSVRERRPVFSILVNESGASVYSASEGSRQEFPRLDLTIRGAISIARRLQDPLAELVKVHPKSIGVGQYQHDVEQKRLKQGLEATVESCVNRVGVDLNTASFELLRYVSGVNQRLAKEIVTYRHQHGKFSSRPQLFQVPGFGDKTYEQAAGFLRIKGGENPLDATAVHPESYPVVERMAQSLGLMPAELIENPRTVESLDLKHFCDEKVGLYTLNDIKQELIKPGRDPRDQFAVPTFREDVKEVGDLKEDMVLEGTVTNVTNFGAFVDIGVHQDGLVHVSELSNRFVKDPREAVHVGEVVKVKVIGVDVAMKRISLSMKALLPKLKRIKPGKAQKSIRHNQTPVKAAEAVAAAKHTAPAEAAAAKKDQPVKFQQSRLKRNLRKTPHLRRRRSPRSPLNQSYRWRIKSACFKKNSAA
ncbi:MAG: RNA-binding transcriptional accessory protein [Acidobacteria bacterium]|nr:MAG: RNA-binding transcriptional accessory protein [Acidobacteriota bacterium]